MLIKTSELSGSALDYAVAQCNHPKAIEFFTEVYSPSTVWAQGGPIIEREKLTLDISCNHQRWFANHTIEGPTPLIAAMRCYVASKLGDEVDIPEEFIQ